MNKFIFCLIIFIHNYTFSQELKTNLCDFSSLEFYIDDQSGTKTNIRSEPNGKVILKIDNSIDEYIATIIDFKNGWFKINKIESLSGDFDFPKLNGWIHYSVIGASTRKNLTLLNEPNGKKIIGSIKQETGIKIKNICSDWAEIETKQSNGWVKLKWLCGNPVTTCP